MLRARLSWALALALALAATVAETRAAGDAAAGSAERGAYVFAAAGCAECHTEKGGKPLAGGRALKTPYGTFYSPNITPDPAAGIGKWSETDFRRALREGIGPDGTHFFPAFPYPSFTLMTDEDIRDLFAYLKSLPAVAQANRRHELRFPFRYRLLMLGWNRLYLKRGPLPPDPERSPQWNRGAYLVQALGHCGECHTPRNWFGALNWEKVLSGSTAGPDGESVPNLTPDQDTGIGKWSEKDIVYLLETGQKPDGDDVGHGMNAVVDQSTSKLTPEDRAAVAAYLKALPPVRHQIGKK
ncbi:MAG: c-type cytochrome [Alphaproteobacteria bacterium]